MTLQKCEKEEIHAIQDIQVVEEICYLGVTIATKRKSLEKHKQQNLDKAKNPVNITYSILGTNCNRAPIGKTFWKGLAMPSFLYGPEILDYNNTDIEKTAKTR